MADDGLVPLCDEAMPSKTTRVVAIGVATFVVLLLVGGTLWQTFDPAPTRRVIGREAADQEVAAASARRVSDGSWMRAVEKDLKEASRTKYVFSPYWSEFLFSTFGETDEALLAGSDDWLFLRRRFTRLEEPPYFKGDEISRATAVVTAIARRLETVGTRLVVVPVPRKCELFVDHLPGWVRNPGVGMHNAFVASLRAEGVDTVDVLPGMWAAGPTSWWKHDSHWSDRGAKIAADSVAALVGKFVPPGPMPKPVESVGLRESPSDLLRTAGIHRADGSGPRALVERGDDIRVLDPKTRKPLRNTPPADVQDVSVCGTSYSAFADGLFPAIVGARLGMPVSVDAWPALGPVEPLRRALTRFSKSRFPKVLVWEVPEHEPFCVDPDFGAIGEAFAAVPDAMPFGVPAMPFIQGPKVEQRHDLNGVGTGWVFFRDSFVVPGDGVLSIRLKGEVVGAPVRISVSTDSMHASAEWVPGSPSITLPLLGNELVRYVRIVAMPRGGRAVIDLKSIDAVTSLDLAGASALEITEPVGKDASVLAEVRFPEGSNDTQWMWLRLGFGGKYGAVRLVGLNGDKPTSWTFDLMRERYDREIVLPRRRGLTGYRVVAVGDGQKPKIDGLLVRTVRAP